MDLEGRFTAVFRNKTTGEITKEVSALNHVQDWALDDLIGLSRGISFPGTVCITSTDSVHQKRDWHHMSADNYRSGIYVAGLPLNEVITNVEPGIHVYREAAQFSAPDEPYPINGAFLRSTNDTVIAAVRFDVTCVQETNEILTVYYQIQVRFNALWFTSNDTYQLNEYEAELLANRFKNGTSLINNHAGASDVISYNGIAGFEGRKIIKSRVITGFSSETDESNYDMFRESKRVVFDIDSNTGTLFYNIFTGQKVFGFPVESVLDTPLQGVFGHNDIGNTPFYDAGANSAGTGNIVISHAGHDPGAFAEYVKVDIQDTGALGVSSYNFSVRNSTGFVGNTFEDAGIDIPVLSAENRYLVKDLVTYDLDTGEGFCMYPYHEYKILYLDSDVIVIPNLITHEADVIDNEFLASGDVVSRFLATNITQVHADSNNDFWVACGDTGLYFFTEDLQTLTTFLPVVPGLLGTLGCYGVTRGYNNRIWAYFNHVTAPDLYYSDDEGASWNAAGSTIMAGDATSVRGIQVDVDAANGHILVMYLYGTYDIGSFWWEHSTLTSSAGPKVGNLSNHKQVATLKDTQHMTSFQFSVCADGVWACLFGDQGNVMTFGTNTFTGEYTNPTGHIIVPTTDELGNTAFFVTASSNQKVLLIRTDGTIETSDTDYNNLTIFALPINKGIWIGRHNEIYQKPYYKFCGISGHTDTWTDLPGLRSNTWTDYGWNGSLWVENYVGNKPTHNASETLYGSVGISFDDNATAPDAFLASDNYTFGLYKGIWMDGSTTFTFDHYMYYKPTKIETAVEAPTLGTELRDPNHLVEIIPQDLGDWVDGLNAAVSLPGYLAATLKNVAWGAKTAVPCMIGDITPIVPIHTAKESHLTNVKGYVTGTVYGGFEGKVGLIFDETFAYAFEIDRSPIDGTIRIDARSQGVLVGSTSRVLQTDTSFEFRFIFTHSREMYFEIRVNDDSWILVHKTNINVVVLVNYYFMVDGLEVNSYAGTKDLVFHSMTPSDSSYYHYLGDGISQGVHSDDFYAIDSDFLTVFIDGIQAVNIGDYDGSSFLSTNTYSAYPLSGIIRYSSEDVGKTITATYITLTST